MADQPGVSLSLASQRERRLIRAARLLSLLALAAAVLAYPLAISDALLLRLVQATENWPLGRRLLEIAEPLLRFGFSPLALKETLGAWLAMPAIACWLTAKILNPFREEHPRPEVWALLVFAGFMGLSSLWAPHFGFDSSLAHGTFNLAVWTLWLLALIDMPASRRFERRMVHWIVILAGILMAVSILQALPRVSDGLAWVMKRFPGEFNRNLYGSLIGHNTGVASACLGAFFFVLGGAIASRRPWTIVLSSLYLTASLYFFVITQSRAIWAILIVGTPLFLFTLYYFLGLRIRRRHGLGAAVLLLAILATQFVSGPQNFLRPSDVDYRSRMHGMKPSVMLQGTRVRVLFVMAPVIPERLWQGHGLGAFPVLYPKAQADYFADHPDTPLRPSNALTLRAHNDHLQLLLEGGLTGYGLAVIALILFVRRAVTAVRRRKATSDRLRVHCALFAIGTMLVHALVDFPFHVFPIAVLFLHYAALAYGPAVKAANTRTAADTPERRFRPAKVAQLVALMLIWIAVAGGYFFTGKRLLADMYASQAGSLLRFGTSRDHVLTANQRLAAFAGARQDFRQSNILDPLQFVTLIETAQTNYNLASLYSQEQTKAQEAGEAGLADQARQNAARFIGTARRQLLIASRMAKPIYGLSPAPSEDEPGPRQNHVLLHNLARCWLLIHRLEPNHPTALTNAWKNLQLAVRYNPANGEVTLEAIDLMREFNLGSPQTEQYYRRMVGRYAPRLLAETVSRRAERLFDRERFDAARKELRNAMLALDPGAARDEMGHLLAIACLQSGRPEAVLEDYGFILNSVSPHAQQIVYQAGLAMAHHQWETALELCQANPPILETPDHFMNVMRSLVLEKLGRTDEAEEVWQAALEATEDPARLASTRSRMRLSLADDPPGALKDAQAAFNARPGSIHAATLALLLRHAGEQGDTQAFQEILDHARESFPDSPLFERIDHQYNPEP